MARGDYTAIGVTGLDTTSGMIREDYLRELVGERGRRVIWEMSNQDPVVGAILFAIEMLVRQVEWPVNPADDSTEAEDIAEFVRGCFDDMSSSWEDTLAEILSFLPYGWSWFEVVYKQRSGEQAEDSKNAESRFDDGRIGWRKFAPRPQDTLHKWIFDAEGGVQAMVQLAAPDWKERIIPIGRSLLFRTSVAKGNPEGRSILRPAYRPWYFKKHIENIEGIGIERDLAGLPVGWVPSSIMVPGASEDDKAIYTQIKTIVKNIKRDATEGLVLPLAYDANGNLMYKLELLSSSGSRQFDTDKIIGRYDSRIAMTVLADFILLGQQSVGSWALSSDKTDLFAVALRTILSQIKGILNSHAIPRLMRLNGIKRELWPEVDFGDIERVNLGEVATYIQQLSGAGMPLFPDAELEKHLRDLGGLPAPVEATEDAGTVPAPAAIPDDEDEPDADAEDAEEVGRQSNEPLPFHAHHNQKTHGHRVKDGVLSRKSDNGWEAVKPKGGGSSNGKSGGTATATKPKATPKATPKAKPAADAASFKEADAKAMKKQSEAWGQELEYEEHEAIFEYTDSAYKWVNDGLRKPPPATTKEETDLLDSALGKFSLNDDTLLFRGVNDSYFKDMQVGQRIQDKGYGSTTISRSTARTFAQKKKTRAGKNRGGALMEIRAKAGTNGAFVSSESSFPNEEEFLLGRNSTMRLVEIRPPKNKLDYPTYVMELE